MLDDKVTSGSILLRHACLDDIDKYFEWVNDLDVRQQSFNTKPILQKEHQTWFKEKLILQSCVMFVMEINNEPVGQIRFDIKKNIAYIDYSLDKKVRGRQLGAVLVSQGIDSVSNNKNLIFHANVKLNNTASSKTLLQLGFHEKINFDLNSREFEFSLITK